MNIKPLHDVCIIRPHKEVHSKGGILIPRNAEEFHEDIGEVLYTGPGQMADDGKILPDTHQISCYRKRKQKSAYPKGA